MASANSPNTPPAGGRIPRASVSGTLATTSCILGVLSLVFVPWLGLSGFVLGLAAIVAGAVAIRQIRRDQTAGRVRAITGLVSGIGICIVCGGILLWFHYSSGGFTNTVPVATQPQDEGTAKDLGGTIAEMGRCDTLEYVGGESGVWTSVCDRLHDDPEKSESFTIQVYADSEAKQTETTQLRAEGFRYKEGPSFLVIAARRAEHPHPPWHVLDGFPGSPPAHHS